MKKIILILSLVFFVFAGYSQTSILLDVAKVPVPVKEAFKKKSLKATEIKWFKVKEGFLVKYKFADQDEEIVYDKLGVVLRTKVKMDAEKLPKQITDDLDNNHKDKEIDQVFLVTEGKKEKYYSIILLEEVGKKEEPKVYEIQYTPQGKLITIYEPEVVSNEDEENDQDTIVDKKTAKIEEEAENLAEVSNGEKVKPKDLPSPITEYMKAHFNYEYKYKVCEIQQNDKFGEVYYIIMKKQGEKKQFIHYFDTNGKLLEATED